jgi:hypothetical protein
LGSRDADWQAARPTTPYAPPKPPASAGAAASVPVADAIDDSHDDPQGGLSAHLLNLQADGAAVPDQPAEGGDFEDRAESPSVGDENPGETPSEMPIVGEETPTDVTLAPESAEPAPTEETAEADSAPTSDQNASTPSAPAAESKYQGEGVYIGTEPPEGFRIKGNERSMKYHVPESAGYGRTVAEVWFNSEDAAQQAGFVRAQR